MIVIQGSYHTGFCNQGQFVGLVNRGICNTFYTFIAAHYPLIAVLPHSRSDARFRGRNLAFRIRSTRIDPPKVGRHLDSPGVGCNIHLGKWYIASIHTGLALLLVEIGVGSGCKGLMVFFQ